MTVRRWIPVTLAALALVAEAVACRRKEAVRPAAIHSSPGPDVTEIHQRGGSERVGPSALAPLTEAQALTVLPKEMAAVAPGLPAMYRQVNALAIAQGLEGWPEALSPFADDPDPSYRADPFKTLHPAVRLIWGNAQVLWVHVADRERWDALVLMKVAESREDSPWRLMLIKDAFGHPTLAPALPGDTWNGRNTLDWSAKVSLTYAKTLGDLQAQWAYCTHPASLAFTCCMPESDAGLSLQYDPDLGVGLQISGVAEEDPGEDMNWYLSPKEFSAAEIIRMGKDFVWVNTGKARGVASRADWDRWTATFKPAKSTP